MKIGVLIPATSAQRNWKTYKDSYLYKYTLKTFLITYNNNEHQYIFYIGIDKDDDMFGNEKIIAQFKRFMNIMKNVSIQFHMMDANKGHVTVMWNQLFKLAYNDKCDYFFQCGDDIVFKTKDWVNDCIDALQKNNNKGMSGPINNNMRILTQTFVSRNHMKLFGYYFPPEIINWFCDDWINEIYKKLGWFYPLKNHYCENVGGKPRYVINNDPSFTKNMQKKFTEARLFCMKLVKRDLDKLSPDTLHGPSITHGMPLK